MSYTSGTATDYHDLLNTMRTWLTGTCGWTQLKWTAPASLTDTAELWLEAPGAGAGKRVYVGFRSINVAADGMYSWETVGATAYSTSFAFDGQAGESGSTFFNLWQNSIDYWMYANDRRVIVVAKVSSYYMSMYAGFFLPFATPDEFTQPLYIGASSATLLLYSSSNSGSRMMCDPGLGAAYYRKRSSGTWSAVGNHTAQNNTAYLPTYSTSRHIIWPYRVARSSGSSYGSKDWNALNGLARLRPNAAGEMPLFQSHIIDTSGLEVVGALDGVFAAPGFGRTSEQTLTMDTRTFRLFQNCGRATARDFFAVEVL
jgi:hypothetical protein